MSRGFGLIFLVIVMVIVMVTVMVIGIFIFQRSDSLGESQPSGTSRGRVQNILTNNKS